MVKAMTLQPMSGGEMLALINTPDYKRKTRSFVTDVSKSMETIKNFFNGVPDESGRSIDAITKMRDLIWTSCNNNRELCNSFMIVAPHTHWKADKPIIYSFDDPNDRYIIGHHDVSVREVYYPCSFIFSDTGPIPYEWFDKTINNFHLSVLNTCYGIIESINKKLLSYRWPFGITIDFRFKNDITDPSVSTIEIPILNETDRFFGFSYIIIDKQEKYFHNDELIEIEQVAWHPMSDKSLNLKKHELNTLNRIRKLFSQLNEDEKKLFRSMISEVPGSATGNTD
jgi:hypothetical protein